MLDTVKSHLAPSNTPLRPRSLRAAAAVLLAATLLPLNTSCISFGLKVPVGDPNDGWADPRITGIWVQTTADRRSFWIFEPLDTRTWLITVAAFTDTVPPAVVESQAGAADASDATTDAENRVSQTDPAPILAALGNHQLKVTGAEIYKGWLASIGPRRFLVLERKCAPSSERGFQPNEWLVLRTHLNDGRLSLTLLDNTVDGLSTVRSRFRAEQILARHGSLRKGWAFTLLPIPRPYFDKLRAELEDAPLSTH